jgi:CRISPR-associated protein Cas2
MAGKFIFTYDIADNNRLRKVAKELEKSAVRVQYSVFEFEGSDKEAEKLLNSLERLINKEEDRIYMFKLTNIKEKKIIRIGKGKNEVFL